MIASGVPRADLHDALLDRARRGGPLLLTGPPGAGKTTLLLSVAAALTREGRLTVYLDLMGAVSSPDRFVSAALDALPAAAFSRLLPRATEIRRIADSGRSHGAEAVRALFSLWSLLDEADGRPVVLLLDEITEIRSLAYFIGLRDVAEPFGAALAARTGGTLLATSFPTLARKLWSWDVLEARPFAQGDLTEIDGMADSETILRACFGWPRYVRVLVDAASAGDDVVTAWAREMSAGGRLETACRHTYESLLLRSRGYGMSKAVLAAVAGEEGLNLTALVSRLGRTPGAVRDYLQWLVGVDALRMIKKRYYFVDGLVCQWVRLHARGAPPSLEELEAAGRALVSGLPARSSPEPAKGPLEPESPPRQHDRLMEID